MKDILVAVGFVSAFIFTIIGIVTTIFWIEERLRQRTQQQSSGLVGRKKEK